MYFYLYLDFIKHVVKYKVFFRSIKIFYFKMYGPFKGSRERVYNQITSPPTWVRHFTDNIQRLRALNYNSNVRFNSNCTTRRSV